MISTLLFTVIIGLVLGSFLGALSYRLPRNLNIAKGRSFCPKCKKQIAWYDNIPLLSYMLLGGKCRNCHKNISLREPLIEIFTAFVLSTALIYRQSIVSNLSWLPENIILQLVIIFVLAAALITIFVIDIEQQIIPDSLVFLIFGIVVGNMILNGFTPIYDYLTAGFVGSLFLLVVHLLTAGKGMGLGDVKLALALALMLGPTQSILWYFISFILGGCVGVFLMLLKNAKMKDKVAFGPFLILSFFIVAVFGSELTAIIFPYVF